MATQKFIDVHSIAKFPKETFKARAPYPWHAFQGFLTLEGFRKLYESFPPLERFEKHENLERGYGQRPHNRYYLAYEESSYHPQSYRGRGVVKNGELPDAWQEFIEELEGSGYQNFVKSALGVSRFEARYVWHVAVNDSEVSPHLDVLEKAGLHMFYFNTSQDWDPSWGGSTLVLGGLKQDVKNPDFSDFEESTAVPFLDNSSFFFRNQSHAWHGVRALTCPQGKRRRLFSVIFETPKHPARKILRVAKRLLLRQKKYPGERS